MSSSDYSLRTIPDCRSLPLTRSGEHVPPLQPWHAAGPKLQGPEGEQGAVSQGEAKAQREDQQRGHGVCSVSERRAADPHVHQRLQEHERLPHEEGATPLKDLQFTEFDL